MKAKIHIALIAVISHVTWLHAEPGGTSPEFGDLRNRYNKDVQTAYSEITKRYVDALKFLLKKQMMAGNTSQANATQAEIEKISLQHSLAGNWKEADGRIVYISPFGNVTETKLDHNTGVWIKKDDIIQIKWGNGYTDLLLLSKDGTSLVGKNNIGGPVIYKKQ